jgi:hypothetical protein
MSQAISATAGIYVGVALLLVVAALRFAPADTLRQERAVAVPQSPGLT